MSENRFVTEVARRFADYIDRVVYRGERLVLVRGNKPVAELRPLPARKRLAELPDLIASLPRLSEDEAAEFADDLASAKSVLTATNVRDR
jgi:antitoxin (DNA-binding transcriptional repressor) of toxin-antitoxin stability system